MVGWTGTAAPWHPSLLVTQGRTCPQDLLPCPPCQAPAAGAPARMGSPALPPLVLQVVLGTRQGKQLVKSFNFYDTRTTNRVKGIRGTGPKIYSTLQTVNKTPYECKTVSSTVTNTIIFQLKVISTCALRLETPQVLQLCNCI